MILRSICIVALTVGAAFAQPQGQAPSFWASEWPDTDFTRSTIRDWASIQSGGPPKDGIPALDDPAMVAVADMRALNDREPVMAWQGRAYPIRYLMWHEIVNDTADGVPVAVTFCPLCNTGMVFDRRADDRVLAFGVSGKLRHSDMIMYDRQTQSWWQQATGSAIVGVLSGTKLVQLPALMQGWGAFRAANPNGMVMAEPDWPRRYGTNPYVGYDSAARPFLYAGEDPPHGIAPLARVVRVGDRAWPLERLRAEGRIAEAGVVLEWSTGQVSALDTGDLASGAEVGNVTVTGADGALVVFDLPFAFAFQAFHPKGTWMVGG